MKVIDLSQSSPSLTDVLDLAGKENVLMKTPSGREYVVAEIDDLDKEIALIRGNQELMQLLEERFKEKATLSLDQVRKNLGLN